jgi:hypothetical protein
MSKNWFPNWRAVFYFMVAILGAVVPWYYNLQHYSGGGTTAEFFTLGFVNPVASSLSADLTFGALAFTVWMAVEGRRLGMRLWGIYLVLIFTVAFAFAGPLFLWARERTLSATD